MKRLILTSAVSMFFGISGVAMAGNAATSATAGSGRGPHGTVGASATFQGERGFARTESQSGPVNISRGVAVGVDQNGLALSVSNAVAPKNGPAVATNFNLSIGRNGEVSSSTGITVARGGSEREATAGGNAGTGRPATSVASGRTEHGGTVDVRTAANTSRPLARPVVRVPLREPVRVVESRPLGGRYWRGAR